MKKIILSLVVLTCAEISYCQIVSNGLIAHYELNGDAVDATTNQMHGTNYGAVPAMDRFGKTDGCMYFNGAGAFIEVLSSSSNMPELVSVSVWVKPEDRVNRHTPISKRLIHNAHPHNSYAITTTEIGPNGKWQFAASDFTSYSQTTIEDTVLYDLDWTHIVGTYDGSEMRLYVNGQLVSSTQKTGDILYSPMTLRIGHAIPGTSQTDFRGWIDDVRIYNRGLTSTEVDSLFQTNLTSMRKTATEETIQFYPNPAKGTIQVNSDQIKEVRIIDLQGRIQTVNVSNHSIDLNSIPKGIYIFETITPDGYYRQKVQIID